jgi:hypothetical protein
MKGVQRATVRVTGRTAIAVALVGCLLAWCAVGCSPQSDALSAGQRPTPTGGGNWPPAVEQETWDAIYIDGQKVGYGRTKVVPQMSGNQGILRIENEYYLKLKRFGDTVEQRVIQRCTQTESGKLLACETESSSGPQTRTTKAVPRDGHLLIQTTTAGKTTQSAIDWNEDYGGYYAIETSLRRQPMKPGETRNVSYLVPLLDQVVQVQLRAVGRESTELLGQSQTLLRVDSITTLKDGQDIEVTFWLDEAGEALKSYMPGLQQTTYRTSKPDALQPTGGGFDLGKATTVVLNRSLTKPHETHEIVFHVRVSGKDPRGLFAQGPTQSVTSLGPEEATIRVRTIDPNHPEHLDPPDGPPTAADRQPNNLIQSDDATIVRMAAAVAPDETDPWKLACALEKYVSESISQKDFTQAFATAAEVAQTMQGDCTEHAVLLAALCRSRQIPARVAIGLVYFEQAGQGAMAYHMWTEVWIGDRWIPLDGTLGQGGIGAAHLKLTHSNLDGVDAYAALLPVFQVMRQLHLRIDSVR